MFKNNVDAEADFCEAYKSQILNDDTEEKDSPLASILTILLLLVIIIALSIYGYNYFMSSDKSHSSVPPVSIQTMEDDELKIVIPKEEAIKKVVTQNNQTASSPNLYKDVNKMVDDVKIAIAKSEEKNTSLKEREIDGDKEERIKTKEPTYIEVLADSEPEDTTKSTYIKKLEELTAEIDKERN